MKIAIVAIGRLAANLRIGADELLPGLGRLALQFARELGFRVVAVSTGNGYAAMAHAFGAHHFIDARGFVPDGKEIRMVDSSPERPSQLICQPRAATSRRMMESWGSMPATSTATSGSTTTGGTSARAISRCSIRRPIGG